MKPELKHLRALKSPSGEIRINIIKTIAPKWQQVGVYFDFDDGELHRIATENPDSPEVCCNQMMKCWLEGKGKQQATWGALLEILKDAGYNDLAYRLEDEVFLGYKGRGNRINTHMYEEQQENEEEEEEEEEKEEEEEEEEEEKEEEDGREEKAGTLSTPNKVVTGISLRIIIYSQTVPLPLLYICTISICTHTHTPIT